MLLKELSLPEINFNAVRTCVNELLQQTRIKQDYFGEAFFPAIIIEPDKSWACVNAGLTTNTKN